VAVIVEKMSFNNTPIITFRQDRVRYFPMQLRTITPYCQGRTALYTVPGARPSDKFRAQTNTQDKLVT